MPKLEALVHKSYDFEKELGVK